MPQMDVFTIKKLTAVVRERLRVKEEQMKTLAASAEEDRQIIADFEGKLANAEEELETKSKKKSKKRKG